MGKPEDEPVFQVIARVPGDVDRARQVAAYLNWAWKAPIEGENLYQFLAFMWLLVRAHNRMLQFWQYGNNPPN